MSTQPKRRSIEPGVYVRVGADGDRIGDTFEIAWKDANRNTQRRGGFRTQQEARDALILAKGRRVEKVREPDRVRLTLNEVADRWDETHVARQRTNTQKTYRAALVHLRARFGSKRMTAIDRADVRAYIAGKNALAGATVASHLTVLSAVFQYAIDDLGLRCPNPVRGLKRADRPKRAKGGMIIVNDEQLARLLGIAPDEHRLYFRVLAETGARRSEGLGLTWVDVGEGTLRIHQQRDRFTGRPADLKNSDNADAARTVVVTSSLTSALREHRLASPRSSDHDYVFAGIEYDRVDRVWAAMRDAAGLGKVEHHGAVVVPAMRLHDLRHSHVSGLIADGWDIVRIAKRIGDTIATVQATYAHLFDEARFADLERAALTARYDRMATNTPQQTAAAVAGGGAQVAQLSQIRNGGQ